ncbi:hypothetical protein CR513_33765, partial [Mucuna pruriens]
MLSLANPNDEECNSKGFLLGYEVGDDQIQIFYLQYAYDASFAPKKSIAFAWKVIVDRILSKINLNRRKVRGGGEKSRSRTWESKKIEVSLVDMVQQTLMDDG